MTDISLDAYLARSAIVEAAGCARVAIEEAMGFLSAPHIRMKAAVFPDGSQWCCLYGDNLQVGVAGFGDTPYAACADFDEAWSTQRSPHVPRDKAIELAEASQ